MSATASPPIGLIVPPVQGEVPADGPRLYPHARFIARGLGLAEISTRGYEQVIDRVVGCARELRDAGACAISMMGTSLSFYRGAAFTESLRGAMEEATAVPCTTMSHAVVAAMKRLAIRRAAVATAYVDDVNERLVRFLGEHGLVAAAIRGLAITGVREVGEVGGAVLIDLSRQVYAEASDADGVFISCGGLLTLDVLAPLEAMLGVPVVSSSPAGFWDVMRLAGRDASASGYGRLFEPDVPGTR